MLEQTFLSKMKHRAALFLPNNYVLFKKNWEIWNSETEETYICGTFEKAKEVDIGGITLAEYVKKSNPNIFEIELGE